MRICISELKNKCTKSW